MPTKISRVITVTFVAEVPDTDDWADEYDLDPHDLPAIESDVDTWLRNAIPTVLTEMPGGANSMVIRDVELVDADEAKDVDQDPPAGRQIRVVWQTEEIREYAKVIKVPAEVGDTDDEIDEWISDGNNAALVEAEDAATYDLSSFLRATESWQRI